MKDTLRFIAICFIVMLTCAACASSSAQTVLTPAPATTTSNTAALTVAPANKASEAEKLVYDQEYAKAITLLTEIIESQGPSAYTLTLRGVSYAKLNQPNYAIIDLIEASKIDYSANSLINIGNAERMFGRCERAADAYNKALVLAPNDYQIMINLASAYLCYGELDLAEEILNKTQVINANDEVLATNKSILAAMRKDYPTARAMAEKAIQLNAGYAPAYKALSHACGPLKDKECIDNSEQTYKNLTKPKKIIRRKR